MSYRFWLNDGHPQRYHIVALVLAMVAVSLALTARSLAEDGISSSGSGSTTSCSYSYSSWGECQSSGQRYRTVTGASPSGCSTVTAPVVNEACTYTPPSCSYTYSDWGTCQSNGKQYRTVTSASPSGCVTTTSPTLERSCTYTAPTTGTTSSSTSSGSTTTSTTTSSGSTTTQCSYNYSSWSDCQSNGQRSRSVTGMSPTGCVQTTTPVVTESCTYTAPTTTSTSTTFPTGTSATNTTSSLGSTASTVTQCTYAYGSWGNCESNGRRSRSLVSKTPSGCAEYTQPVLEQTCIYDNTSLSTASSSSSSTATAATTGTSTSDSLPATSSTMVVTPTFVFKNVTEGAVWKGDVSIEGEVQGATDVEYYLVPLGSNIFKYIGSAQSSGGARWKINFHTSDFPNGEFYLRAKIKNRYGEYGSGQRKVHIVNGNGGGMETIDPLTEQQAVAAFNKEKEARVVAVAQELSIPLAGTSDKTSLDEQKKQIFSYCESQPRKCSSERDSDQDGLSDVDEIRYGTDPKSADSDLDGFIDSDEVKNGFDPNKYSPGDQSDRMVFENPKQTGEVKKNYAVSSVTLKQDNAGKPTFHLTGKGLPNSFVTLYIYSSDPIVLTVKTDSNGNWVYDLDKDIGDGEHEAYVAVTDNTGKITAKSEPIAFVKTAQAVTVIPKVEAAPPTATQSVSQNRSQHDLIFLISLIVAGFAIALAAIGLIKHHHNLNKDNLVILPPQE